MTTRRPRIIVGCDGSPESAAALDWAVRHARDTNGSVSIVSTWQWPTFQHVPITYGQWDPEESARSIVDRLRGTVDLTDDQVRVGVARGNAGRILIEQAKDADLLVVGSHGLGAISRLVLGSVSSYCAAHATCPVVIVRADAGPQRRGILVGVDDSDGARRALRWAMDYAEVADQPVTVLHVVEPPPPPIPSGYPVEFTYPRAAMHRRVRGWLRELVDKEQADRGGSPPVGVRLRVLDGHPASVMVRQSKRSTLTVCGRRGSGGFRHLLVGSVAAALAHHGQSTLVVTPSG